MMYAIEKSGTIETRTILLNCPFYRRSTLIEEEHAVRPKSSKLRKEYNEDESYGHVNILLNKL